MDRTGKFEFEGVEYPTLVSARVLDACVKHTGKPIDKFFESFSGGDIEETVFILSEMLKAGYTAAKRVGADAKIPPTYDYLMDFIGFSDLAVANFVIMDTMTKSLRRDVNAEPPKKQEAEPEAENR